MHTIPNTILIDEIAELASLDDVIAAGLETAKDTERLLHEVDAVIRASKTVGVYVLITGHPVLELFAFRKGLAKLFASFGRTVTFLRSKRELCGTIIGLPFDEQLAHAINSIDNMAVTYDTKRESVNLIQTLFSQLQQASTELSIDFSHIVVSKHGHRISADAVLYVNDTCRVLHACFGSNNYAFHILVGNHYFYEQPCLDYTFGVDQFKEMLAKSVTEMLEHFQKANLSDDKKMLQSQSKEITTMRDTLSEATNTVSTSNETVEEHGDACAAQQTIELSPAEKTAAALHHLFSTKLQEADTVTRPEEHYCMAEYFANVFNIVCYKQFAAQDADFVLYGVTFKLMPTTIGISFLAVQRKLADSDNVAKADIEEAAKLNRIFIGVSPEAQTVEFAYRINGKASSTQTLQLTDTTTTSVMREWIAKVLSDFVAALKLGLKQSQ